MLIFFLIVSIGSPLTDHVDLVEVNHCYNADGRLMFDQVIWYNFGYERFDVVAWRILKNVRNGKDEFIPRHATPIPDSRLHVSFWRDKGVRRKVIAKIYRETWTTYDPELKEREFLPSKQRQGLRKHEVQ